jgi:primosomal protein N'
MKCPRCGKELPEYDEKAQHNFCPTCSDGQNVVFICMDCKMSELRLAKRSLKR